MGKRNKPRSNGKEEKNAYTEYRDRMEKDPMLLWRNLPPEDPATVSARMAQRKGKKTLAVLGTSPDSCGLTPFNEPGIEEYWALNDAHHLPHMQPNMDKVTRWFQLHQPWRYRRPTPRFGVAHWDWLKEDHPFPIYMQRVDEEVPKSVKYPLYELAKEYLYSEKYQQWLIGRGRGWQRKYFSCSFSYLAALALHEGFERIELYGVELAQKVEYMMQRPNTEFWMGLCVGKGVQLYVPQITRVLGGVFYAYRYPSLGDAYQEAVQSKKVLEDRLAKETDKEKRAMVKHELDTLWFPQPTDADEDNVGEWPEPAMMVGGFAGAFSDLEYEKAVRGYEDEVVTAKDTEPVPELPGA